MEKRARFEESEGIDLNPVREPAKLVSTDGWVICPVCKMMKLLRLPPDGKVKAYAYCRHCKRERFLNIDLSLSQ